MSAKSGLSSDAIKTSPRVPRALSSFEAMPPQVLREVQQYLSACSVLRIDLDLEWLERGRPVRTSKMRVIASDKAVVCKLGCPEWERYSENCTLYYRSSDSDFLEASFHSAMTSLAASLQEQDPQFSHIQINSKLDKLRKGTGARLLFAKRDGNVSIELFTYPNETQRKFIRWDAEFLPGRGETPRNQTAARLQPQRYQGVHLEPEFEDDRGVTWNTRRELRKALWNLPEFKYKATVLDLDFREIAHGTLRFSWARGGSSEAIDDLSRSSRKCRERLKNPKGP